MEANGLAFGIVSNVWRTQLEAGEAIDDLIAESLRRGFRAIELRQTCLGVYEVGAETMPDAGALAELPERFPDATFNIALAFPCFGAVSETDERCLASGIEAALALASRGTAHLRLVDLTTSAEQASAAAIDEVTSRIAAWAETIAHRGGMLSIENSRQPWWFTLHALGAARRRLGDKAPHLRLCYDPCNLLTAPDQVDCGAATQWLVAKELACVHLKQQIAGRLATVVCDGAVDWADQFQTLRDIGYKGPMLFEIAPDKYVWNNLEISRSYVTGLAAELNR
jgi:sugar phosphate isomerase/epimerase